MNRFLLIDILDYLCGDAPIMIVNVTSDSEPMIYDGTVSDVPDRIRYLYVGIAGIRNHKLMFIC